MTYWNMSKAEYMKMGGVKRKTICSVLSNDSGSEPQRPWSDCASDLGRSLIWAIAVHTCIFSLVVTHVFYLQQWSQRTMSLSASTRDWSVKRQNIYCIKPWLVKPSYANLCTCLCCAQCAEVCNCSLIKPIWKICKTRKNNSLVMKESWRHSFWSYCAVFLCLCVAGFICDACFVIVCSSPLLPLMPREGCASLLWHLCVFTLIFDQLTKNTHFLLAAKNNLLFYSKYSRAKITSFSSISSSMVKQSHVTGRDENCWNEHCGNILFRKDILTFHCTNSTLICPGKHYVHFC